MISIIKLLEFPDLKSYCTFYFILLLLHELLTLQPIELQSVDSLPTELLAEQREWMLSQH